MMNTLTQLEKDLVSQQAECLARAAALRANGCGDEAALEQVRANIFEILATVARTAQARFPNDPAAFFRERLENIPRAWRESLAAAEAHGDHTKAEIERVKLQTAGEIGAAFEKLTEGAP